MTRLSGNLQERFPSAGAQASSLMTPPLPASPAPSVSVFLRGFCCEHSTHFGRTKHEKSVTRALKDQADKVLDQGKLEKPE